MGCSEAIILQQENHVIIDTYFSDNSFGVIAFSTMHTTSITGATFIGHTSVAVHFVNTFATLTDCNFINNLADPVIHVENTNLNMIGSRMITNTAATNGNMKVLASRVTITNCFFASNTVTGNGGALFIDRNSNVEIGGTTFEYNEATSGAAIYSNSNAIDIVGGSFYDNIATANGGAMFLIGNRAFITDVLFVGNTGASGGALALEQGAQAWIRHSDFADNTATNNGGVVVVESGGMLKLAYANISGGYAMRGGGISVTDSTAEIVLSTITDNNASVGGGIFSDRESTVLILNNIH